MAFLKPALAIIFIWPVIAFAQLNADFSANKTKGCSPLVLTFQNNSTGNITGYQWDFGNGNKSTLKNPSVSYVSPGTYSVRLIITDGTNVDSIYKKNYITVFKNPEAAFSTNDNEGCAPFTTSFKDNSIKGDGDLSGWLWDFGDGSISTVQNPSHTFSTPGSFSISLSITDKNGCKDFEVINNMILATPTPVADFTVDHPFSCDTPAVLTFTSLSKGSKPLKHNWDFGNGVTSVKDSAKVIYRNFGTFDITLKVEDKNGCRDSFTLKNTISVRKFQPSFTVDQKYGCIQPVKTKFSFTNSSTPVVNFSFWDFGDGATSDDKNPTHIYDKPGVYPVMLITGNSGCTDTLFDTVYVNDLEAKFTTGKTLSCKAPFKVIFKNDSRNAHSWTWLLGDGTVSFKDSFSYTYNTEDSFPVTLIITNKMGCMDTSEVTWIVVDSPEAHFYMDSVKGCAPLNVDFYSRSGSLDPIVKYEWDFGDGNTGTGKNTSNTFINTGIYYPRLTITTKQGCTDTSERRVMAGNKPTADFFADKKEACAGETVTFTVQTNFADSIRWDFGDGKPRLDNVTSYKYEDTGLFTITIFPFHLGCRGDTVIKKDHVYIKGPVAGFSYEVNCDDPLTVYFKDESLVPQRWLWEFSNGDTSHREIFTKTFNDTGSYELKLTVTNDSTGCSHSTPGRVDLFYPTISFTANPKKACAPFLKADFNATASKGINPTTLVWEFGRGNNDSFDIRHIYDLDSLYEPPFQVFNDPGIYRIKLSGSDIHGCTDSMIRKIKIYGHDTRIGASAVTGCLPQKISFFDSSLVDTNVTDWYWDFGDTTFDYSANPQHIFTRSGNFRVVLKTMDAFGCMDSAFTRITISNPKASFFIGGNYACAFEEILFKATSKGKNLRYLWDFGDGDTSTQAEPFHSYNREDTFTVSLVVIDSNECRDTLTMRNSVFINKPEAEFTADTLKAPCPSFLVNFQNLSSTDVSKWEWDFGDGKYSFKKDPSHVYTRAGKFNVLLWVENTQGCRDSALKNVYIEVGGPTSDWIVDPDNGCAPHKVDFISYNQKGVDSVYWDYGSGITVKGDTFSFTYEDYGKYYPKMILYGGVQGSLLCSYGIEIDTVVVYNAIADFNFSGNSTCINDTLEIRDSSRHNVVNYWWDINGDSTSTQKNPGRIFFRDTTEHYISLKIETAEGCTDSTTKTFQVKGLPNIWADGDNFICREDNAQLRARKRDGFKYQWYPSSSVSDPQSPHPLASPDSTTYFYVSVTDSNNCKARSGLVKVVVQQKPLVIADPDTIIIVGDTATLRFKTDQRVTGAIWKPSMDISCTDCKNPRVNPLETREYFIEVNDTNNCFTITDGALVKVVDEITLRVPGAFSPNGDGLNDIIYVRGWGIKELLEFKIYNRWGELVFSSTDINEGWNGYYMGQLQNMDTYVWHAKGRSFTGKVREAKGSFSLIR